MKVVAVHHRLCPSFCVMDIPMFHWFSMGVRWASCILRATSDADAVPKHFKGPAGRPASTQGSTHA